MKATSVLGEHDVVIPPGLVRLDRFICGASVWALPGQLVVAHLVLSCVHRLCAAHEALNVAMLVLLLSSRQGFHCVRYKKVWDWCQCEANGVCFDSE